MLDKDEGQPEADFFGFGLLLLGEDEPLLGVGEHFLLLEQHRDVVDGDEGVRLQDQGLLIAVDGQ